MKLSQIAFNSFILVSLAAIAGGCESQQRSPASGIRTVGYAAPSNGYGLAPVLPKVRITCADGKYDYVYTARTEIDGSKADPKGSQFIDLGHNPGGPSAYRLNIDRGFVVLGGCFPVYVPPERESSTLPPKPWSPAIALGAIGTSAQGTRYSIYVETTTGGDESRVFVFRHGGGPVHAWTFAPGTDPQAAGSYETIPNTGAAKYFVATKQSSGSWSSAIYELPAAGSSEAARKYFDACDEVAQNWKIGFPNCAIPESPRPTER